MNIEKIDSNFKIIREVDGMLEYPIPSEYVDLYGVTYNTKENAFCRMDPEIAHSVSDGVGALNWCTAGGRLRFATNSKKLTIKVSMNSTNLMHHMTILGSTGFSLTDEINGRECLKAIFPPQFGSKNWQATTLLSGEMQYYTLYFPLYNDVKGLTLCIDKDSVLEKGRPYKNIKPILYYGSSITQGGCSSRPDTCYQAMIAKWNNVDFINLGLSGNAKAEDNMTNYLATIDCSLFVYDYDHNAPNVEHLKATHYKLYKAFRKQQPKTPILLVSRPDAYRSDDAKARYEIIRDTYESACIEGDKNIRILNGKNMFGKQDPEACTVDGCHPNDLGFYRMAKAIYREIKKFDERFE